MTLPIATEATGLFWNKYSANKESQLFITGLNQQGLLSKFLKNMSEKREGGARQEKKQNKTPNQTNRTPTNYKGDK